MHYYLNHWLKIKVTKTTLLHKIGSHACTNTVLLVVSIWY